MTYMGILYYGTNQHLWTWEDMNTRGYENTDQVGVVKMAFNTNGSLDDKI